MTCAAQSQTVPTRIQDCLLARMSQYSTTMPLSYVALHRIWGHSKAKIDGFQVVSPNLHSDQKRAAGFELRASSFELELSLREASRKITTNSRSQIPDFHNVK